ncbi:Hypothetical predicted protein [Mytilus galloprovincialis]|uniref:Uncharacterized protein n=1 Tax=Mytilus galloprovincialis TaxID=29158 RepID=A0A8B6GJU8_MYTGA|nr:Hypothetical predicted protein [Mytilus galloprovincialis]
MQLYLFYELYIIIVKHSSEMKLTQWPGGNYALHTSMFGCPEDVDYGWMSGYVNMTLLPKSRNMFWNDLDWFTFEPHILGPYTQQAIQINFCIMNSTTTATADNPWPAGNYCIYKASDICPIGFNEGSMTVRGYTYDLGGDLPDLQIDNSTDLTLMYCCREDGNADESIQLPHDFPFILFLGPTTEKCQEVDNMKWTLNGFYLVNEHLNFEYDGLHPNFSGHAVYHRHVGLPLCYYEPLRKRECVFKTDFGASYKGHKNITKSGRQCSLWEDNSSDFTTSTRWIGEFEENYCRKIDMGLKTPPGCYIGDEFESCDIPECEDDPEYLEIFGKGRSYNSAPSLSSKPASYAVDGLIVWFPVNHRYVGTYVSKNRWDFLTYGAYRCEENRNPRKSTIFRYQCKRPIIGQYVSVTNFDFTNENAKQGYYHFFEIEEIQVIGKSTMCGRQLGLISGDVYDYQLESSSRKDKEHLSNYGRLFFPETGWCSGSDDVSPWFIVDFIVPLKLQGVELQGIKDGSNTQFIDSFKIMYGNDRSNLTFYEDPIGTVKIFRINPMISALSIHQFIFNKEIYGRYLKVVPVDYKEACLKLEVIGCPKQVRRDLWCRDTKFDFGFEVLRYHSFWMAEHHDIERMSKTGIDLKQCFERCQNISCISFSSEYSDSRCTLHFGHKYTPEYHRWWIEGVNPGNVCYQRLCFKDFLEFNTCGGDVFLKNDNDESIILSPNFPFNYGQGLTCVWSIYSTMFIEIEIVSISLQRKILLSEMQKMSIYDINPGQCEDSLSIIDHDGYGKNILPNEDQLNGVKLLSASNKIKIQLTSCYQFQRNNQKSFELKVSTIDLPGCGGLDSCFKTCNQSSAYIYTPGFPIAYQPGEACFWKIEGTYGQFVKLTIINLDVTDDSSCEKSFISVYDIDLQGQAKSLGKFCKDNRPYETFISSWERLQIEFKAATDIPGSGGFLGKYNMDTFIQESFDVSNDSCPDNWHAFRNSCYSLQKKKFGITWIEAENECNNHNGHLVSIANISEMKFIHYLITVFKDNLEGDRAYIGLRKKTNGYTMRDYVWSDEKPLTFTAWFFDKSTGFAQPDGLENEQCSIIQLFSIHNINAWHDVACAYNKISNFICETEMISNVNDNIRNSINQVTARPDEILYLCNSGEYILNILICDSVIDCISGDDEQNCSSSCSNDQFTCDDGSCISISLHCDFIQHCQDGSDEQFCERRTCSTNEWQCKNMQCIPVHQRCDFVTNCYDKSDEILCEICGSESFQCYDQTCIPFSRVCDGVIDCSGLFHEDESEDCLKKTQHTCKDWYASGSKENGVYLIDLYLNDSASVECLFNEWENYTQITTIVHHDNEETVTATLDGYDIKPVYFASDAHIEVLKDIGKCSQSIGVYCHFSENRVYRSSKYGDIIDNKTPKNDCGCPFVGNCDSGVKRCNCGNEPYDWYTADNNEIRSDIGVIYNETQLPVKHTYTLPTTTYNKLHLGPLKCIEDFQISSNIFRCSGGQTVPSEVLCILDYDEKKEILGCRDLSHLTTCETSNCPPGYLKCTDSYCIPPNLLCNGVQDCPAGEDENGCS